MQAGKPAMMGRIGKIGTGADKAAMKMVGGIGAKAGKTAMERRIGQIGGRVAEATVTRSGGPAVGAAAAATGKLLIGEKVAMTAAIAAARIGIGPRMAAMKMGRLWKRAVPLGPQSGKNPVFTQSQSM